MSRALEDYFATQKALRMAALLLVLAEMSLDTDDAGVPALMEAQAAFDLAARAHARAVDGLPMERKPKGWDTP